ncbi:hypothetical protein L198_02909 [Cryptococcus wingfieldii CBS 7118]|uniref:Uncharacterized protein n=1 Tax=Cryptococcus wingfieldii CBS 7118 TaxID=1295528 RepID=A0A1E3JI70_9TREE|nr:hypothetical protein L198_02909 [Cryptococcus wingfieldii CBS 7118]ODO00589.1 hypothetical protein L198_02909 [Cryptococcus wingfieldii CBS 7118]
MSQYTKQTWTAAPTLTTTTAPTNDADGQHTQHTQQTQQSQDSAAVDYTYHHASARLVTRPISLSKLDLQKYGCLLPPSSSSSSSSPSPFPSHLSLSQEKEKEQEAETFLLSISSYDPDSKTVKRKVLSVLSLDDDIGLMNHAKRSIRLPRGG